MNTLQPSRAGKLLILSVWAMALAAAPAEALVAPKAPVRLSANLPTLKLSPSLKAPALSAGSSLKSLLRPDAGGSKLGGKDFLGGDWTDGPSGVLVILPKGPKSPVLSAAAAIPVSASAEEDAAVVKALDSLFDTAFAKAKSLAAEAELELAY